MKYSNNLIINPSAETGDLTGWNTSGTRVITGGTNGTKCFKISSNGFMSQSNDYLAFVLQPVLFIAEISYRYPSIEITDVADVDAFCIVSLEYLDIGKDTFLLPLYATNSEWYRKQLTCEVRQDSILLGYEIKIYVGSNSPELYIDEISLISGIDGLGAHELDEHPHQLPLAITVNQEGIKATKGEEVMFWLKDDGDAIYKGELSAAQITTGLIQSSQIATDQLVVGDNIQMGPNAVISWDNVTDQPYIPSDSYITRITEDTIKTGYLYARNLEVNSANIIGRITADSIVAGAIDGETITGALIQTDRYPNRRIEMHSGGITSYDYRDDRHGFSLNDYGEFQLYNNDYLIGEIKYDTSGAGTPSEARERLFITTLRGYAMKLESSGNMSISADEIWFEGDVHLPSSHGTPYVGSVPLDSYIRSIVKEYL